MSDAWWQDELCQEENLSPNPGPCHLALPLCSSLLSWSYCLAPQNWLPFSPGSSFMEDGAPATLWGRKGCPPRDTTSPSPFFR